MLPVKFFLWKFYHLFFLHFPYDSFLKNINFIVWDIYGNGNEPPHGWGISLMCYQELFALSNILRPEIFVFVIFCYWQVYIILLWSLDSIFWYCKNLYGQFGYCKIFLLQIFVYICITGKLSQTIICIIFITEVLRSQFQFFQKFEIERITVELVKTYHKNKYSS